MEAERERKGKWHIEKTADYMNGALALYKGWELLDHFQQFQLRIIFLFAIGAVIIAGTILEERIERKVRNFSAYFHIFESVSLFICATIFLEKGRSRLPALFFFLGLVALALGLTKLLAGEEGRKKVMVRMQIAMGIAFAAFAVVMSVVMAILPFYRHPFMVLTVGFMAAGGIFNVVMGRTRLQKMNSALRVPKEAE